MRTDNITQPNPDPDATTPGTGVRVETDAVRAGYNFGVWKILAGSLVLVLVGYALVSIFFIGSSADGA